MCAAPPRKRPLRFAFAEGAAISPYCLASVLRWPRLIRAKAGSVAQIFENLPFGASTQHACQENGVLLLE
jgi:hypothetical protein